MRWSLYFLSGLVASVVCYALLAPPAEFSSRLVPIDPSITWFSNEMYNDESTAKTWWDEESALSYGLHRLNPTRMMYFNDVLERVHCTRREGSTLECEKRDIRVLDIGCGGGLLTEGLAKLGYTMVGVDLSERSIAEAKKHAMESGVDNVEYRKASAYDLSMFDDDTFDAVVMSDVLEHLHDLPLVMSEIGRVLKKGGTFTFDTINRTWWSWLAIKMVGEFRGFLLPEGSHDWRMFITPHEAKQLVETINATLVDVRGIVPVMSPSNMIAKASPRALFSSFQLSSDVSGSYAGYAVVGSDR